MKSTWWVSSATVMVKPPARRSRSCVDPSSPACTRARSLTVLPVSAATPPRIVEKKPVASALTIPRGVICACTPLAGVIQSDAMRVLRS